jgi:hypothetical protein
MVRAGGRVEYKDLEGDQTTVKKEIRTVFAKNRESFIIQFFGKVLIVALNGRMVGMKKF